MTPPPIKLDHFLPQQIFHIFRMINRIRKTRKSLLLYLDRDEYIPVYSEGYSFAVFSRLKIPEDYQPFVRSEKIRRFFQVDDQSVKPFLCESFELGGIPFLYLSSDYSFSEPNIPLELLNEDFFKQGNLLALKKCGYFFSRCRNSLTLHFICITYAQDTGFANILRTEAALYRRSMTLFASHSMVIRIDFAKILILSDYDFYPDPSSIQTHISDILTEIIPLTASISVRTVLSDSSLIDEKEIIDEFFR